MKILNGLKNRRRTAEFLQQREHVGVMSLSVNFLFGSISNVESTDNNCLSFISRLYEVEQLREKNAPERGVHAPPNLRNDSYRKSDSEVNLNDALTNVHISRISAAVGDVEAIQFPLFPLSVQLFYSTCRGHFRALLHSSNPPSIHHHCRSPCASFPRPFYSGSPGVLGGGQSSPSMASTNSCFSWRRGSSPGKSLLP